MMKEGLKRGVGYFIRPGSKPMDLDQQLQSQVKEGQVAIAPSWHGIARWIGVPLNVLKSTVDGYNRFCDQGYDNDFLKDRSHLVPLRTPPYYGIKCVSTYLDAIGGIKINHQMEVLDHDDKRIPGLYAAGVTTSGWEPRTYCIKLAGNAFGFAINSGRIAGENAAKYVKGKKGN
jgi:fumarate reductase flavoprotein subunit